MDWIIWLAQFSEAVRQAVHTIEAADPAPIVEPFRNEPLLAVSF